MAGFSGVKMRLTDVKTHELEACPGCGARELAEFRFGHHPLQRCSTCGLVAGMRYGDPEEIYIDGYLSEETDFGLDLTDPHFQLLLEHCAHIRMRIIEEVVGAPGRVLDVGCGSGEVLAAARERGWQTHGVEPVPASARIAGVERGLDVRQALLEESGLPERTYDVVSAFHVLEHMSDGQSFLRTLSRWARPRGWIVVEVPNWRSVHRRLIGASWPGMRPLEHIGYYSPATLEATMRRAGVEPVRIATRTYLWADQTLEQQLYDLGLVRWLRWARPLGRAGTHRGRAAIMPSAVGSRILKGTALLYDRAKVGMVVVGIGQVP